MGNLSHREVKELAQFTQAELEAQQTVLARSLEQFFTKAVNDYNEKQFRLSDGIFLYQKKHYNKFAYNDGLWRD